MRNAVLATLIVALGSLIQVTAVAAESLSGEGTWQSNSGSSIRGAWTATLVRSEDALAGEFVIDGSPLFTGGSTTGSLTDDDIVLGIIVSEGAQATFKGSLRGDEIEGTWELPEISDTGTWQGTLR